MAQVLRTLAAKPDTLSSISRTHVVEGEDGQAAIRPSYML